MRFTLIKNIKQDSAMSLILKGLLVFIFIYLTADILVMKSSFGISADSISTTLFGNEDEYVDPMTESSFLEFWHTQIFFIMMILLTLNAIFIRITDKGKIVITNLLMLSAVISLVSLPLSFYLSEKFVDIYLSTFFIWHGVGGYMTIYSFWRLHAKSI